MLCELLNFIVKLEQCNLALSCCRILFIYIVTYIFWKTVQYCTLFMIPSSGNLFHTLWRMKKNQRELTIRDTSLQPPEMIKSIVIGDETWCFQYDPTTKQNGSWKIYLKPRKHEKHLQKLRQSSSQKEWSTKNSFHLVKQLLLNII